MNEYPEHQISYLCIACLRAACPHRQANLSNRFTAACNLRLDEICLRVT